MQHLRASRSLIDIKLGEGVYALPQVKERQEGLREEKLHRIEVILCMSMLSLFQSDIDFCVLSA